MLALWDSKVFKPSSRDLEKLASGGAAAARSRQLMGGARPSSATVYCLGSRAGISFYHMFVIKLEMSI